MAWPQSQDYNEAIQNTKSCFKDAELSKGQAVTNPLGMPLPCSGNFADVYQVHCPQTNTRWAVKCFTRGNPAALAERYARIDEHLQNAKLPFTVGFRYLEEGIRIRNQWHPVLKMQWVEGFTLNHFIRDNLDKPNLLEALLQIWVRMAKRLREADMAHADLQHGNVLLVPGNTASSLSVKLIDYDGMWVPVLAGSKSGEVGHPAYQHTKRLYEGTYSKEVDRFPLLVVATALRCLRVVGRPLWEKFDNGDNLLFREADLAAPERSPLFAELEKVQDAQAQRLVEAVRQGCSEPLEQAPFLDTLLPEALPARKAAVSPQSSTKMKSATGNGIQTEPEPEGAFAGFGDTNPDTEKAPRPRRRRDSESPAAPAWKKWALIGGGAGAALLALVLVLALSGGKKDGPEKPPEDRVADNKDDSRKNTDDSGKPKKTDNTEKKDNKDTTESKDNKDNKDGKDKRVDPPKRQLALRVPLAMRITPGSFSLFNIGLTGARDADTQMQLQGLPAGVQAERTETNSETGTYGWRFSVGKDVSPGDYEVTVVAKVDQTLIEDRFRLTVGQPRVVQKPPDPVDLVKLSTPQKSANLPLECRSMEFGPDGHTLVGLSGNNETYAWETEKTQSPARSRNAMYMMACGFMPDGLHVVYAGQDKNVYLGNLRKPEPQLLGKQEAQVLGFAVSRDGTRAVSTSGEVVIEDGKALIKDGQTVWKHLTLKVWDLQMRKELRQVTDLPAPCHSLAISGDGKRAMGSLYIDRKFVGIVWDLETGTERGRFQSLTPIITRSLRLSGDGKMAALALPSKVIALLNLETGKEIRRMGPIPESIRCLTFSSDDRFILSGSGEHKKSKDDKVEEGYARLWEVATGRELVRIEQPSPVVAVALSRDGSRAATSDQDKTLRLWDLKRGGIKIDPPIKPDPPVVSDRKKTPPDEAQRKAALEVIKDLYKTEYARTKLVDRIALADLLLIKAREVKDNPTDRYVLLKESADLSVQFGNTKPALAALELLDEEFVVDGMELKINALTALGKALPSAAGQKSLAEASVAVLDEARTAENYDALTRLANLAESAANRSQDTAVKTKVLASVKEARETVKESEAAHQAEMTLKTDPDDGPANAIRGKFLCFRLGAWSRGLPLLARCDDKQLKDLAGSDLAAPEKPEECAKLGDVWYELAKKHAELGKTESLRRSSYWYHHALNGELTALNKDRVEKQLKAIDDQLPPTRTAQVGGELRKLEGHSRPVTQAVYLSDGVRVLSAAEDGTFRLWDANTGKELKQSRITNSQRARCLAVSADGRSFLAAIESRLEFWDMLGDRLRSSNQTGGGGRSVAYIGKSKRIVAGTADGSIWLMEDGVQEETKVLDVRNSAGSQNAIAVCTGNSGLVLSGTESGALLLYPLLGSRPKPVRLGMHKGAILAVALAQDGLKGISVGEDKTARVWDLKQARELRRLVGHSGEITSVAFAPDNRLAATGGEDGTVRVWDTTTGHEVRRFLGHKGKVASVSFSPDGRRIVSGGEDMTVRVWSR